MDSLTRDCCSFICRFSEASDHKLFTETSSGPSVLCINGRNINANVKLIKVVLKLPEVGTPEINN